jgi:hypothetical protein
MTDSFESILDESISALQAGVPIDDILAEVPNYAAELRPLLYAATLLADPNPKLLPDERKEALREIYLKQAAELPALAPTWGEKAQIIFRIIRRRTTRQAVLSDLVTVTITVILTLIMTVFILRFAAGNSLPGDLLYSVKRTSEAVQLGLTFDDERRQALIENFNRRRLAEIEQLIEQERVAIVQFRGILDAQGENLWVVAGYTVVLPEGVIIEGNPQEGDRVEVVGLLRTTHVLVADSIRKVEHP